MLPWQHHLLSVRTYVHVRMHDYTLIGGRGKDRVEGGGVGWGTWMGGMSLYSDCHVSCAVYDIAAGRLIFVYSAP